MDNHIVGTSHDALSLSILIPVKTNQIPLFIRTRHQVRSQIYPPQSFTFYIITLIAVESGLVGSIKNVSCIVSLHYQFCHSISIHITQRYIIQSIRI